MCVLRFLYNIPAAVVIFVPNTSYMNLIVRLAIRCKCDDIEDNPEHKALHFLKEGKWPFICSVT